MNDDPKTVSGRQSQRRAAAHVWVAICVAVTGCAGPAIRSQSPEIEALASLEADTKLIGDYAAPWGLSSQRIERAALVTGLAGTGSDPPPNAQRQSLMADMQARGVVEPNGLLASTSTSLVWVHGYLRPGIRRGDRFDIHVEVPPDTETSSLAGGWLMETRLSEMAVLGSRVRDGHVQGVSEGPLLVDPVSIGTLDPVSKLRAKVPGGGVSLVSRPIGLILTPEHRSVGLSKRIGDCINRRFHTVIRGAKRGVATPKTDRYIELEIPSVYVDNLPRYIRVVRSIAVAEPPGGRHARLQLLERQLAEPVTAPAAAIRLEAIGKEAVPTLRGALASKDAEIRFAAAEALAYLGESVAATHLAEAATNLRTARPAALAALGTIDDANGLDSLRSLLTSTSAETRYGAFRGLWKIDPTSPLVRGDRLGDACTLHVLDVQGPPLVHATRSRRPEIVLFGTEHPIGDGLRAEAGSSIVVVVDGPMAIVSRFTAGDPDQQIETTARLEAIIHAIVELGGTYPDVVQFLQQASSHRALVSRLAFDAVAEEDGRMSIHEEASSRGRAIPADSDLDESDDDATAAPSTDESS
ncbi:MAG: flagellar basal body P-ring protein FlgI [Planctomycetes bacterium]|nr:flagellar basal body P-ring protein FlgI [Planctomycetota bacterium]